MMKYFIGLLFLLSFSDVYSWDCKAIDSTMTLIKSQGCGQVRLCMGYAECTLKDGKKSVGRIMCKADAQFRCPSANECMDQAVHDKYISIAVQTENDPRGIYRFCPSKSTFSLKGAKRTDAVNSRFCNSVSGIYINKQAETVSGMTGVNGGGAQMGHNR
jgi:hypothetical protein